MNGCRKLQSNTANSSPQRGAMSDLLFLREHTHVVAERRRNSSTRPG